MNLLIRADANAQMGMGHVTRCLALAQAWQNVNGQVTFVTGTESPTLDARLKSEGMKIGYMSAQPGSAADAAITADLARRMDATWTVVDGYHFGADYQRIVKKSGQRLLFVDDHGHAEHYYADIVLNQNIHAHESLYANREPSTQLLLGTGYVLLRKEFLERQAAIRDVPGVARRILITLGGADPNNVTLQVVRAVKGLVRWNLEIKIVIGPANPNCDSIQKELGQSPLPFRILTNVTDMPSLMAWADMAVSAGGSTCWELAFMGVPYLVIILAENQVGVAKGLDKANATLNCGWFYALSTKQLSAHCEKMIVDRNVRTNYAAKGQQLVDGLGAERLLECIGKF